MGKIKYFPRTFTLGKAKSNFAGSFGEVFLAKVEGDDTEYAVKFVVDQKAKLSGPKEVIDMLVEK